LILTKLSVFEGGNFVNRDYTDDKFCLPFMIIGQEEICASAVSMLYQVKKEKRCINQKKLSYADKRWWFTYKSNKQIHINIR
jgi:hypothetical protein